MPMRVISIKQNTGWSRASSSMALCSIPQSMPASSATTSYGSSDGSKSVAPRSEQQCHHMRFPRRGIRPYPWSSWY
eukprot:89118-Prymnesium_polylepis.2